MQMERVESSNIRAVGYDSATHTMQVEFHSGAHYEYSGISAAKHADFMAAESKGKHFLKHIIRPHAAKKIEAA